MLTIRKRREKRIKKIYELEKEICDLIFNSDYKYYIAVYNLKDLDKKLNKLKNLIGKI